MENNSKTKRRVTAVIVAAGTGQRMGGVEKPLIKLGKNTVFSMVLDAFEKSETVTDIVVVCRDNARLLPISSHYTAKEIRFAPGGKTRTESVLNGVLMAGNTDIVCIHDCARPFITAENIDAVVNAVYETGASCACKSVSDTIKYTDENGAAQYTPQRDRLIAVQTPQVFRKDIYLVASAMGKKNKLSATDDTTLAEAAGFKVKYINIGDNNDKLTTAEDIRRAKARIFLAEREKEGK
ncbi:MAG: 2-C-methyl-D-erythritol 4-phosphate cytidylyltransferase [Clostridia bacterium]|nr:2-C-methyl-D-erythritol 4-phosphate cytidylyltransferase [Clostridia bacterium]MBO7215417.1 2-C-methyl-D-erythritol 4-phosphate cytidylyltransferase [Clostridia bacterium]